MVSFRCSALKDRGLIIGTWAMNPENNVEFVIDKEFIQYFDTNYLYNYKMQHGKLMIFDSTKLVLKFKIHRLTSDSLVLESENSGNLGIIYRYYKVNTSN
jgi:hypothetical protein